MRPILSPSQARVVRALTAILSSEGKQKLTQTGEFSGFVLEDIVSQPWASLTFAGERHRIVGRLPAGGRPVAIDSDSLAVPGKIVAVEGVAWCQTAEGPRLTLAMLTLAAARRP